MSPTRRKLTIDEQAFQDLLAAAYTIQEHNAKVKRPVSGPKYCGHCGAPVLPGEGVCAMCGADREGFRSGERLQQKWATLWDLSPEHGANPEVGGADEIATANGFGADILDLREPVGEPPGPDISAAAPGQAGQEEPRPPDPLDHSLPPLWPPELPPVSPDSLSSELPLPSIHRSESTKEPAEESQGATAGVFTRLQAVAGGMLIHKPVESLPPENMAYHPWNHVEEPSPVAADDEVPDATLPPFVAALGDDSREASASSQPKLPPPAQLKLHFDRADLYLGLAIVVAALVLLWVAFGHSAAPQPAHAGPHRARLSLWERTLVSAGLAEAPAEEPVFRGDPTVMVWVDPHTALYYCRGSEQYGKTPNGRYSTQRDAQRDWFEPAERSVCE